ncbi:MULTISPECIES: microviridin/marinostatin family tricyclic proteinase inhibitor [unclassified Moorena]|uniref:microviridin/marinostatin family tricyclic proteinase inhibitor n=1 Tax=unclassified Moorena TaxID=2683338 RepID=UPI0013B97EC2|nr:MULTISPECIES: microviridin/marinostatin family tricyclic proteinase inhibitor [unclassified Moorena]NEP35227.1 microviridin/marinostatin family tricyclic proteinase inhibitor [Moorena sp. SIO3B2]NEQ09113.1 microviridin/marinostatin family tricyclic proteinase inhibitor [Moorena sp. SIO4E2]NES43442.1 microviridin/marinostatin family tricyclic proteinase inhibitor [Moorena sp. SIO2C4]
MSDMNNPEENSQAVPFFARYLEGQFIEDLSKEEMETVKGGNVLPIRSLTRKYPSDREDWSGVTFKFRDDLIVETQKYPSDQEDI